MAVLACFVGSLFWWVMGGGTANGSAERREQPKAKQACELIESEMNATKKEDNSLSFLLNYEKEKKRVALPPSLWSE